jgi:type IV pilus assembly protein PilN
MRIGINLASRPYQDEGLFYSKWGTALALVVLFTASMVAMSARHYVSSQKEWASARKAEAKLADLKKQQALAEQILAEPQNRGTRDLSQFLNTAILRKSFSWTRLMEDLEKVMPAGIRVVSIAPVNDQRNRFSLRLDLQGESRDSAIELLRNMEKSQHFVFPQLIAESGPGDARGGPQEGIRSEILTAYVPAEPTSGGE